MKNIFKNAVTLVSFVSVAAVTAFVVSEAVYAVRRREFEELSEDLLEDVEDTVYNIMYEDKD